MGILAPLGGTQWYWREWDYKGNIKSSSNLTPEMADFYTPVQTGKAFDIQVSKQLKDDNRMYIHGGNNFYSPDRFNDGYDKGYQEAANIIKNLKRDKNGNLETIKIVTHSMGGVYGNGFYWGLEEYIKEHYSDKKTPKAKDAKVTMVADFDPYQASDIDNDDSGDLWEFQFTHKGIFKNLISGWIANEKEKGKNVKYFQSPDKGSHSIMSFYNDIPLLDAGTYVYDQTTNQWIIQTSH